MTTATTDFSNNRDTGREDKPTALPLRGDTLLGVCEAVGQDLGVNPTWLRITFAALLLWNPEVVVIAYLGLGLVVAATRWFFPARTATQSVTAVAAAPETASVVQESEKEELLAA
ncbi:MAG TPA: PspC domain-containing protein [Sphingomicrobium sp.]|nr:PspC domain-containing protein [Sphingomicrobium sp.]